MRKNLLFTALFLVACLWCSFCYASDSGTSTTAARQSVIEGVLTHVSKLPKAESNPYPDCYYTAVIEIKNILSGESMPKRAILVLPGFFARQYAPEATFKTGDMVKATVVPFASMPDKVRQIQQADDIEDVDLEFYYALPISKIKSFEEGNATLCFADRNKRLETTDRKDKEPAAITARLQQMRHDLQYIAEELAKHGGDWDSWYESLSGFRAEYKKSFDAKAHLWVGDSYFSAGQNVYGKGYSRDFVSSLIAFNNYLKERDVDLIVVRVPQKGEIVEDLFTSAPKEQVSNPYLLRLYKELLEADVEVVVDAVPRLKQARLKFPLMYYYQDFQEEHPAEGTAWVLAEIVAERLQRYESIRKASKAPLNRQKKSLPPSTYKWPAGNPKFNPSEAVSFDAITSQKLSPLLKQGITSPILVVGSSFIGTPSFEHGGNIPAYLGYLIGVVPDILYREGSNASIPRTIAREGDIFLKNRTVCVFPLVPWAIHLPLDLPPIVNPATKERFLVSTYTGDNLKRVIRFSEETPRNVFSYSADGSLKIQPRSKETRLAGDFTLDLPEMVSQYPWLMIVIETKTKDAAAVKATFGMQSDTVHKSYTQDNIEEAFIFKREADSHNVVFNVSNLRTDSPMSIKAIKIYGLR